MKTCDGSSSTTGNLEVDFSINPSFIVSDTESIFQDFYILSDASTAGNDGPVNVKQTKEFHDVNTSVDDDHSNDFSVNKNDYFCDTGLKEVKVSSKKRRMSRKLFNINNILKDVEIASRYVLSKAINNPANDAADNISYTNVETIFEGTVYNAFIDSLNKIKSTPKEFYKLINDSFSDDLEVFQFSKRLSKNLGIIHNRFLTRLELWKKNSFVDSRGNKSLILGMQQMIYDEWIENSIPSVVNGKQLLHIKVYFKSFNGIKNERINI